MCCCCYSDLLVAATLLIFVGLRSQGSEPVCFYAAVKYFTAPKSSFCIAASLLKSAYDFKRANAQLCLKLRLAWSFACMIRS